MVHIYFVKGHFGIELCFVYVIATETGSCKCMELFTEAKVVKLRSHLEKYLVADDDQETVHQSQNSSGKTARWLVELVPDKPYVIRLKSCHGKYLAATDIPFLLGMTGKMVLQTVPDKMDWKLQWKPIREGFKIKLKSWCGKFLRANGGTPPWRNSITHGESRIGATNKWVLWDVEVGEYSESLSYSRVFMEYLLSISSFFPESEEVLEAFSDDSLASSPPSPVSVVSSLKSPRSSVVPTGSRESGKLSSDFYLDSPPKSKGRTICYHVADETGEVDDEAMEGHSFSFKGNGVDELTHKLKQETGLEDVVVCARSPLNGELFPLCLRIPPNNLDMHVVVVPLASKR
ncbi:hypothetical protein ES288_A01G160400v1 [Gossypium darwinii]|uniref:Uncharacterized protein n=1 Tax=Gossypium darwinii TaxID=34276 RepID=A0A5D2HNJ6_GOSDA|nr:hypothetical protein ES288_A01G160400v1 [Gossypium darwinii]